MADIDQMVRALKAADAAGDTAAATKIAAAIRAQQQAQPAVALPAQTAPAAPQPSMPEWQQRTRAGMQRLSGATEVAAQMASATPAAIAGGLAGIAGTVLPGEQGQGARWTKGVQDALTYQPRSESGQELSADLSKPMQAYEGFADRAGEVSGTPSQTLGATAVKTALMAAPAVMGLRSAPKTPLKAAKPPTTQQLKTQASQAYEAADNAGVVIRKDSFRNAVDAIKQKLAAEGIDKTLHPDSMSALRRLMDDADKNVSLKGAEIYRRIINDAASSTKPADRRLAKVMRKEFDRYLEGLGNADVISGDPKTATKALSEARGTWQKVKKSETIEGAIEKAKTRGSQYTGSGYENALRVEFRKIAMNDKKMRMFSPDEQAAIKRVAEGGAIGNAMRRLGTLAPRGAVTGVTGLVAEGILPGSGLALWGAGEIGRRAATSSTARNARMAAELMRSGARPPHVSGLPSKTQLALAAALAQQHQP